jgi:glycosyltransferase involved in cell wall biosynthesis
MKILFLNYEYPPLGGGAANATACILEEWVTDETLEVHLVTSSTGGTLETTTPGGRVHIHRLPIGKNAHNLHHQSIKDLLMYSLRGYWYARRLIRDQEVPFDATLAFFGVPCGFMALLLRLEFGLPYIVALRGSDVPGYSLKYNWLYPLIRPIIWVIWSRATAVVPNSVGLAELARQTAPKQSFTIIENGVDIRRFVPDTSKRSSDEFIITPGASRVTERKGLNYLIEAVAILAPKYPTLRLKVMGDGSARPALEALVKERGLEGKVVFLGRIPREETSTYYQEASLFVLPSLNEGMSNAMLEALATGLPIIATPTGGTAELVTEGKNGTVVPEQSVTALVSAIEPFLESPELVTAYGAESRKRAEAQGWDRVAESFKDVLENSIKKVS